MGGRGASGGVNGSAEPRGRNYSLRRWLSDLAKNNPPGVAKNAITEDEFLAARGAGSVLSGYLDDKMRSNRQLRTQRGKDKFEREADAAIQSNQSARDEARAEYRNLVSRGVIRDKTTVERLLTTAHGNSDNSSVQAARRSLEKRGIDWKTGKKKKRS